jgi:hypothetical protein
MNKAAILIASSMGAISGVFFGFCLAAAKMLGDAEIHPPNAIPDAPNVIFYMGVGGVIGVLGGLILGFVVVATKYMRSG